MIPYKHHIFKQSLNTPIARNSNNNRTLADKLNNTKHITYHISDRRRPHPKFMPPQSLLIHTIWPPANIDAVEERGRPRTEVGSSRRPAELHGNGAERGDGCEEGQAEKDAKKETRNDGFDDFDLLGRGVSNNGKSAQRL
jgi:hypothetical protein